MEKRLTADLNVVSNSNLEIQLLDGDLNIIQKLDDEPNDVGGLTSAELKAKFDESGNIIKKYINETLIPSVLTDDATEESRKQAEAARVTAEQGRVTAEEGRVSAETARAQAEASRTSAETARGNAESQRASAETTRVDNETARNQGETARVAAESTRANAETARGQAEQNRAQSETARDQAETARRNSENIRATSEAERVQAEQNRVSAEQSRTSAEAAREAAEKARADETSGIVARATAQANAAAAAQSAAGTAESGAKDSATAAAQSAQMAQGAASTAANAASSASQSATTASGSASQAQASAAAAAQSAASVDGINKTAQSWAVGGTNTRPGEDTDNAKYWAKQAEAVVGGDFATKNEAQGYVTEHNQSSDAHSDIRTALNNKEASGTTAAAVAAHNEDTSAHADIRKALSKAGKPFIIEGTLAEDGTTISVDKTRAEIKAAVQANLDVIMHMPVPDTTSMYELPLLYHGTDDSSDTYVFCGVVMSTMTVVFISCSDAGTSGEFEQENLLRVGATTPSAPGTASAGTSTDAARADHVHPSERPKAAQVTLTAAGWNASTKKQTVTVSGVLADTSKQVIWVAFASETALDAYMDAGIVPVAQGANTVTFRADKVPTADISVTVLMQGVLT